MSEDEPDPESEPSRRPFNYGTVVGVVFALIVAVAVVNALRSEDSGTVGIGSVGLGKEVAPFAVPIATSGLDGDANVDPEEACSVKGRDVIRICDYFGSPLVISFWFTKGSSDCIEQQDVFDELAKRYRDRAGFVSINVRDDRDRVRELIAEHDWRVPVGYDRDGAVSNIYRVGGCPTFLFVRPGGVLESSAIGVKTLPELASRVRSLLKPDGQEVKPDKAGS